MTASPFEAADLREALQTGLLRGGALLTAGERAQVEAILTLPAAAFATYANLTGRVDRPHRAEEHPAEVLAALRAAELVDGLVPAAAIAEACTVPELKAACRALGRRSPAGKDALVEALSGVRGWWPGRWFRVRHRALVRRLERWAALSAWPDRKDAVLERLGVVRWPVYDRTRGPALFADRSALLRWEAAALARDPAAALAAWSAGDGDGPGRLSLRRTLADRVRAGAEALERAGALAEAAALYDRWPGRRAEVAFRASRVAEARGDPTSALRGLREGLADATPAEAAALVRAGRRLAKAARTSFPPAPPRPSIPVRTLRMAPAPADGPRPRWGPGGDRVEAAVVGALAAVGRAAFHGEGGPWRTVVSLLLSELYFLPVDGALPVPRLAGPLDLGTAAFADRRAAPLASLVERLRRDGAPTLLAEARARHDGVRLAGVDPSIPGHVLSALAAALPGEVWAGLVALRARGRSFGGMPDLVVLPGPEAALPDAHPRRLPTGLLAVEVKGPTDALRDHQADWFDTLARLGVAVEQWEVVAGGREDRIDVPDSGHGDPGRR